MKITLLDWRDSLLDVGVVGFSGVVEASGAYTGPIGSRPAYAKVTLRFERASDFQVDASSIGNDPRVQSYVQSAVFGALDILMTTHVYAISKVKITVIEINDDEVRSTPRAFRLAGREATRNALKGVDLSKRSPDAAQRNPG